MTASRNRRSVRPDPKPARRIVDPKAVRAAGLSEPWCVACGKPGGSRHHVIPKGAPHFGDDVPANLVVLCGSGTTGCHGGFHGGTAGVDATTIRAIGLGLKRVNVEYVVGKLGDVAGRDYLRRRYQLAGAEVDLILEEGSVR